MKKNAFLKYFIKIEFSRVGAGAGLSVQFLPPIQFGEGGRDGGGDGDA